MTSKVRRPSFASWLARARVELSPGERELLRRHESRLRAQSANTNSQKQERRHG